MQPTVELWDGVGLGMIVSFPSGVHYSNQTGGTACFHPSAEGVYVPLANDCTIPERKLLSPENNLYAYFAGPKHCGSGAWRTGLDDEDAVFIDGVLAQWRLSSFLKVDQTRLVDSHEAWVWTTVTNEDDAVFSGLGPYPRPAVLTWSNTD